MNDHGLITILNFKPFGQVMTFIIFKKKNSQTCALVNFVSHHVHLFLIIWTTKQLRVLNHILITSAQTYTAHYTNKTLFMENALACSHYQFTSSDMITTTATTTVYTPKTNINFFLHFIINNKHYNDLTFVEV